MKRISLSLFVLLTCLAASALTPSADIATNNAVVNGAFIPPSTPIDLLRQSTNTSRTCAFAPANGNQATDRMWLSTNSTLWIWPVNLSCVGFAPNVGTSGNELVLIAPNLVYFANHLAGVIGTRIIFHDINGVRWVGTITNEVHLQGDMALGILSESAPPSIDLPYIMTPSATTNFPGGSIVSAPAFWLHNNDGRVESLKVVGVPEFAAGGIPFCSYISFGPGDGPFAGTLATVGDSSSPFFTVYKNHLIFLGASTFGGFGRQVSTASFISGNTNFFVWQQSSLTNGARILDHF